MRIRLKLLILLLLIALVPLVAVIWYDLRATRLLATELSQRTREVLDGKAARELLGAARDTARLLTHERLLLETAARLQAQAVLDALAAPPPAEAAPAGSIAVTVVGKPSAHRAESLRARLQGAVPALERIRSDSVPHAVRQRIALEAGARAVLPASAAGQDLDDGWVARVREARAAVALPPRQEEGRPVAMVAAPIIEGDGRFLGATAIEARLSAVLGEGSRAGMALIVRPADGGLRLLAGSGAAADAFARPLAPERSPGLDAVLADMGAGRAGVHRATVFGEGALLAHAPLGDDGDHLLLVVPDREIIADALAVQGYVFDQLARQRTVQWLALAVFVPLLIGLASVAARAVTKPVRQLTAAARALADGDFNARTRIRSGDELEELGRLFNVMVPQLDASMRMRDSLALAQEVQQNLLPAAPPVIPGFDIAGLSDYCDETGGDYYDFLPLPEVGPGAVAVMIGDVAGHGIAAALLMTTVRALLRSRAPLPGQLARLTGEVNRQLCRDAHAGRFMTLFVAALDAEARRIHWVGAGHDPGFIYFPHGNTFQEIAGTDIPLGVDPDWQYHELSHVGWTPGTVMLLGTDGIWETRDPSGAMFGKDRLREVIRANADRPAADIAAAVTAALRRFRGRRPAVDDVTLVVVRAL